MRRRSPCQFCSNPPSCNCLGSRQRFRIVRDRVWRVLIDAWDSAAAHPDRVARPSDKPTGELPIEFPQQPQHVRRRSAGRTLADVAQNEAADCEPSCSKSEFGRGNDGRGDRVTMRVPLLAICDRRRQKREVCAACTAVRPQLEKHFARDRVGECFESRPRCYVEPVEIGALKGGQFGAGLRQIQSANRVASGQSRSMSTSSPDLWPNSTATFLPVNWPNLVFSLFVLKSDQPTKLGIFSPNKTGTTRQPRKT